MGTSKLDTVSSFQTSFSTKASDYSEKARPVREGRLDECYCVPVAQCPANKILGNSFKDYSNLINPRVKNSNIGITAPVARTLIDTEDIEEATEEDKTEDKDKISSNESGQERSDSDEKHEEEEEEGITMVMKKVHLWKKREDLKMFLFLKLKKLKFSHVMHKVSSLLKKKRDK